MLAELERGLVDALRSAPLARHLRAIDSLPDLQEESLIGRFITDAPAAYVALGSFPFSSGYGRPKFGIACIAKNSRGQVSARHGDGVTIGLYPLSEAVAGLVDGLSVAVARGEQIETVAFEVTAIDLVTSAALFDKGIVAAVVQLRTAAEIDFRDQVADLTSFKTFHADVDIDNRQSDAEHHKWLAEPPDLATSTPDLSDQVSLQE